MRLGSSYCSKKTVRGKNDISYQYPLNVGGKIKIKKRANRCGLEAFSGNYAAGAMLIFPGERDTGATLYAEGGSCDFVVTMAQADSIWGGSGN